MSNFRDFITGGIAGGDDFFFRRDFIENLWESLHKEHVLMLAPRRMGKSSVMLRLQDYPRNNRLVIYLNVEDLNIRDLPPRRRKKPQPRSGQPLKQAFDDLMLLLQNDFYVEEVAVRQYDFASRILKLWWRRNCG